jgi:hypothetical protein
VSSDAFLLGPESRGFAIAIAAAALESRCDRSKLNMDPWIETGAMAPV